MESVVFFNGNGNERETWELHAGGHLTQRFTEGKAELEASMMHPDHLFSIHLLVPEYASRPKQYLSFTQILAEQVACSRKHADLIAMASMSITKSEGVCYKLKSC